MQRFRDTESDLISLILRREGFDVLSVRTGQAALREAPGLNPALISLDLDLPDADGLQLARKLKKLTAAPLLIVTARVGLLDELDYMAAGASGSLAEPFRAHELRDAAAAKTMLSRTAAVFCTDPPLPNK